jgi:flagellar protein FliO/FliZ
LPAGAAETVTTATSAGGVVQMIVGLVIVLGILLGGAWLLRRFVSLPATANSPLKIVTGLSLSPRDRLVVIQVGERQLLLGLSPGRISTLHVLEQPLDPNATPESSLSQLGQRFGAMLQNQMKK